MSKPKLQRVVELKEEEEEEEEKKKKNIYVHTVLRRKDVTKRPSVSST